jgi:hypothetical protein
MLIIAGVEAAIADLIGKFTQNVHCLLRADRAAKYDNDFIFRGLVSQSDFSTAFFARLR